MELDIVGSVEKTENKDSYWLLAGSSWLWVVLGWLWVILGGSGVIDRLVIPFSNI